MSEANEKNYEFRPLVASDMGAICKVVSAIGVRQFKNCFNVKDLKESSDDLEKIGIGVMFDIAGIIIENIPNAEEQIQSLLSSLTGIKVSEIKKLPFAEYGEMIVELVTKDDFRDFFKRVMKLFNL